MYGINGHFLNFLWKNSLQFCTVKMTYQHQKSRHNSPSRKRGKNPRLSASRSQSRPRSGRPRTRSPTRLRHARSQSPAAATTSSAGHQITNHQDGCSYLKFIKDLLSGKIDPVHLKNLSNYKYTSKDYSFLSNHVLKHYWNWIASFFPLWMA